MTRDDKLNGLEHYERYLEAHRFESTEPAPPMTTTKKPGTERECECGHSEDYHAQRAPYECLATNAKDCPCPAFTPKKEDRK